MNDSHSTNHIGTYNKVIVILAVLTAVEIALSRVALPAVPLIIILVTLALIKATLVAMYYMHLRYDNRLLAGIFIVPLILALLMASFSANAAAR